MKNYNDMTVVEEDVKPGKYVVNYKVNVVSYANILLIEHGAEDCQVDLVGMTIGSAPEYEYKFPVNIERDGDVVIRIMILDPDEKTEPKITECWIEEV